MNIYDHPTNPLSLQRPVDQLSSGHNLPNPDEQGKQGRQTNSVDIAEQIDEVVFAILQRQSRLTKNDVIDELERLSFKVGEKSVNRYLNLMTATGKISCVKGSGTRPNYYSLPRTSFVPSLGIIPRESIPEVPQEHQAKIDSGEIGSSNILEIESKASATKDEPCQSNKTGGSLCAAEVVLESVRQKKQELLKLIELASSQLNDCDATERVLLQMAQQDNEQSKSCEA